MARWPRWFTHWFPSGGDTGPAPCPTPRPRAPEQSPAPCMARAACLKAAAGADVSRGGLAGRPGCGAYGEGDAAGQTRGRLFRARGRPVGTAGPPALHLQRCSWDPEESGFSFPLSLWPGCPHVPLSPCRQPLKSLRRALGGMCTSHSGASVWETGKVEGQEGRPCCPGQQPGGAWCVRQLLPTRCEGHRVPRMDEPGASVHGPGLGRPRLLLSHLFTGPGAPVEEPQQHFPQ